MRIDRWKVKQLMKREGFQTFVEVAEQIGVSNQTLSSWFSGKHGITMSKLAVLCDLLDCTPNDILTMDTEPPPSRSQLLAKKNRRQARVIS